MPRRGGLGVLLTVSDAPAWAEGPGRPPSAQPGTWKPNPSDLADFMRAVAARYSGGFDPDGPGPAPPLPAVQALQVWNEPNIYTNLTPQYEGQTAVSPDLLPGDAERRVRGGEGGRPEDARGHRRNARLWRSPGRQPDAPGDVLARGAVREPGEEEAEAQEEEACREAQSGRGESAAARRSSTSSPTTRSTPAGGRSGTQSTGRRLQRGPGPDRAGAARRRARRDGAAGPASALGDREWWDSNPPNSAGAPLGRQARWIEQAMYLAWKDGASVVDQPRDSRLDERAP